MKFNMTMTTAEFTSMIDIVNQIVPDTVDLEEIITKPGLHKVTTIKNKKIVVETSENSEEIACSYDVDPEFMINLCEMLGGFAGNITGACKALMKHGKLLMQIVGVEEMVQTINGLVVGKECDSEGKPIESDEDEDTEEEETENENVVADHDEAIPTPIADMAQRFDV